MICTAKLTASTRGCDSEETSERQQQQIDKRCLENSTSTQLNQKLKVSLKFLGCDINRVHNQRCTQEPESAQKGSKVGKNALLAK